ncbi:hypothetical protein NIES3974_39120 [Calothrix sp. NIES-3974]|nr:hypothetical protein NIES3974_39120 [Calothrix sp. NIES-3974]
MNTTDELTYQVHNTLRLLAFGSVTENNQQSDTFESTSEPFQSTNSCKGVLELVIKLNNLILQANVAKYRSQEADVAKKISISPW